MSDPSSERSLRIVHLLRAPVGGLFRHVIDLGREQIARGHAVGLVLDASTGGAQAEATLAALAPSLTLGIARLPMRRDPHPADAFALLRVMAILRSANPDVIHGHGAKGALYARLPALSPFARSDVARVYTPHGGSLHYDPASLKGALILGMERLLARRTDMILFESGFAADRFTSVIGTPPCAIRVVHNGLAAAEFDPVEPRPDAADILFVGEMRLLKGVDVLLDALAALGRSMGRATRAVLVGDGPDRAQFVARAAALGLGDSVVFRPPMPAREAFALGRLLVVPSRAESLPYIVLEALAAQLPVVATRVGGIPEIFGTDDGLVPPDDVAALCDALARRMVLTHEERRQAAAATAASVRSRFAAARMSDAVLASYHDALDARRGNAARFAPRRAVPAPRFGLSGQPRP